MYSKPGLRAQDKILYAIFLSFELFLLFLNPGRRLVGWLVVMRIKVDLAIFQTYLDLEAGDNQSLKILGVGCDGFSWPVRI